MKTSFKTPLIIIAVALIACFIVFISRPDEPSKPVGASASDTSHFAPSFELHVEKPRMARFIFGILPTKLEDKIFGGGELRVNHTSRGAEIGSVERNRLELRADGWDFFIEVDGKGRVVPGTRLVFPILLAEKQRTLRCRPAEQAAGYLRTTTRAGSDDLDGSFLVELATCENIKTGKSIEWPPAPLTVRGSFEGLPLLRR